MPRSVDLSPQNFKVDADPTNQLSYEMGIGKPAKDIGHLLLQIPTLIVKAIVGGLGGLITVGSTVIEVALGALTSWANMLKSLLSGVVPSGTGEPALEWFQSGGPFGGIFGFFGVMSGLPSIVTEHTEAIANLNDITAAMGVTVAYVGDMQDMVSVPRSQTWAWGPSSNKTVSVFGFTVPDYGVNLDAKPTSFLPHVQGYPGGSIGNVYYTPIVVDRRGIPDKFRWIAGVDSSIFSIKYYEVALCVYDPTDGKIKKVWGSGDIKDTAASTTTVAEIEIDMGLDTAVDPQIVTPGQILFAAHQQIANGIGQTARRVVAAPQGGIGRPSSMLLNAAHYRTGMYSQGIPSEIALSSLIAGNSFIPWFAVSVMAIPEEGTP